MSKGSITQTKVQAELFVVLKHISSFIWFVFLWWKEEELPDTYSQQTNSWHKSKTLTMFWGGDDQVPPVSDHDEQSNLVLQITPTENAGTKTTHLNAFQCGNRELINTIYNCDAATNYSVNKSLDAHHPLSQNRSDCQTGDCIISQEQISVICSINLYKDVRGQCKSFTKAKFLQEPGYLLRNSVPNQVLEAAKVFSCHSDKKEAYYFFKHCLYDMHVNGSLFYCSNGWHLRNCSQFQCVARFKCPNSYCVQYLHVCNNKWDCPDGSDEINCDIHSCSNMYRCGKYGHCIHLMDICDGVKHCTVGDDELLCDLVSCNAIGCLCLNYAITCYQSPNVTYYFSSLNYLPFVYISIQKSLVSLPHFATANIKYNVVLEVTQNNITEICRNNDNNILFQQAFLLNLAHNNIYALSKCCFQFAFALSCLILKGNKLSQIPQHTFYTLKSLVLLDLSNNFLISLLSYGFQGLSSVLLINLSQENQFDFIQESSFDGINHLGIIAGQDGHLCCFVEQTCISTTVITSSCYHFLSFDLPLKVGPFIEAFILVINGFASLITTLFADKDDACQKKRTGYLFISLTMNFNAILFSITFMLLFVIDKTKSIEITGSYNSEMGSILCGFIGPWLTFLWLASVAILTLLVISRYRVIVKPLKTKFKHTFFMKRLLKRIYLILTVAVTFWGLLFHGTVGFQLSKMPYCSLLGQAHSHMVPFALTVSLILFLFVCSIGVGCISAAAIISLAHKTTKSSKQAISRIRDLAIGNVVIYIASTIIVAIFLWRNIIGLHLGLWFCLLPFSFVLNPILLNWKTVSEKVQSCLFGSREKTHFVHEHRSESVLV